MRKYRTFKKKKLKICQTYQVLNRMHKYCDFFMFTILPYKMNTERSIGYNITLRKRIYT